MMIPLRDPILTFARVKGQNGYVRELRAILDFNSPFSVMLSRDGVSLGYAEAAFRARDWQKTHPSKVPYFLDFRGIERSILLEIAEVSLGELVARDVKTIVLELDLPRMVPIDLILGRSFLDNFKLTLDSERGYLSLVERASPKSGPLVRAVDAHETHPSQVMTPGERTR